MVVRVQLNLQEHVALVVYHRRRFSVEVRHDQKTSCILVAHWLSLLTSSQNLGVSCQFQNRQCTNSSIKFIPCLGCVCQLCCSRDSVVIQRNWVFAVWGRWELQNSLWAGRLAWIIRKQGSPRDQEVINPTATFYRKSLART